MKRIIKNTIIKRPIIRTTQIKTTTTTTGIARQYKKRTNIEIHKNINNNINNYKNNKNNKNRIKLNNKTKREYQRPTINKTKCWNCEENVEKTIAEKKKPADITCQNCGVVQKATTLARMYTFFELFGVDYNVEEETLRNRYLSLQKQFHPDRLVIKEKEEQEAAAEVSRWINTIYRLLKHTHTRYYYITCMELDIEYNDEMDALAKMEMEPEFLMKMFTERTALQEANEEETRELLKKYQTEVIASIHKLKDMLKEQQYKEMLNELAILKYYQRLVDQAEKKIAPTFSTDEYEV